VHKPVAGNRPMLKDERPPLLTKEETVHFIEDGFLFVDRSVLDVPELIEVRQLADRLFSLWDELPRRLAPNVASGSSPVLEIKYCMALAPQFRRTTIFAACQGLACALLGAKQTWCHFDHMVYKHPGGEAIAWHQDLAASRTGLFEPSVHFWIPLQDVTEQDGCLMFVPGTHTGGLLPHIAQHRVGGVQLKLERDPEKLAYVTKPLPLGGFSIHTPRTLHASSKNRGDGVRRAWILQFGVSPASRTSAALVMASSRVFGK
jgi:phytanoyl-CoA hydroxylase